MRKCNVGIVAHVDAGKTTLSEALLFAAGAISRVGRVDKGDAFLDTHAIERERGITVFSKQAMFSYGGVDVTLLDTPGHVDFACEAERVFSVMDACILVISATDPIRAHTRTLWQLLHAHRIPTFLFVNKTDIAERNHADVMKEIKAELSASCVDFRLPPDRFYEEVAAAGGEATLSRYFDTGSVSDEEIRHEIAKRRVFPVYFGAALKGEGVSAFLDGLLRYTEEVSYGPLFGAKVYKIMRDADGNRLTYMKITGGTLRVKSTWTTRTPDGEETEERAEQLRLYSADKGKPVKEAAAGSIVAVLGPKRTYVGQGIGVEPNEANAALEPMFTFRVTFPRELSPVTVYEKLLLLAEEDPSLQPTFDAQSADIQLRLMGDIQADVIRRQMKDRFSMDVDFCRGTILYKETIASPVKGAGHFEPLRHYAEVHLKLQPLSPGEGLVFAADCPTDTLALSFQRLVLTHLEERIHRGVLTGSPITDMKITLTAGRAHLKHTEGGDFRQATYRAVRQGLMKARSVLLEPYVRFTLSLPAENLGRAMTDLSARGCCPEVPDTDGKRASLTGLGPVAVLRTYPADVRAYTKGEGEMTLTFAGYYPCHNTEEVLAEKGYDPLADERQTPDSVFCKNGSGYTVPWNEADALMHISDTEEKADEETAAPVRPVTTRYRGTAAEDKELLRIFEATYGKIKTRTAAERTEYKAEGGEPKPKGKPRMRGEEFLLVDGYNVIYAWEELHGLAGESLDHAREALMRLLSNYAGFHRCHLILVFDAYRVEGGRGSIERCGGIDVVYTKERQTADAYIEKTSYEIAKEHFVRVVTSDAAEQMIALGNGALRVSAAEFYAELKEAALSMGEYFEVK